jgi:hypothetical protein
MAEEYEYLIVYNDSEEALKELGKRGWEVVQIIEMEELCSKIDEDIRKRLDACQPPTGSKYHVLCVLTRG